jgi:hypothetical protein
MGTGKRCLRKCNVRKCHADHCDCTYDQSPAEQEVDHGLGPFSLARKDKRADIEKVPAMLQWGSKPHMPD